MLDFWFLGSLCSSGPALLDAVAVFPAEVGVIDRWCAGIVGGGNEPAFWGVLPVMWCDKFPWLLSVFRAHVEQPSNGHRGM